MRKKIRKKKYLEFYFVVKIINIIQGNKEYFMIFFSYQVFYRKRVLKSQQETKENNVASRNTGLTENNLKKTRLDKADKLIFA